ncbi:hypothetical protein PIROE2DRAFT_7751 [Piromyces sp. E2]|nr:hypothetical protein PIROE2DRAFT_7751 [Piromyces sp. E2]|eukprot:OUM65288.1 hypothetical protein PIROE2DRAFT_7751 [Piromyces sp. E2]
MLTKSLFALVTVACIGGCHGNEYKEYNFDVNTKCRVVGEGDSPSSSPSSSFGALYQNNKNPSVLSYSNFFVNIDGPGGHNQYTVEYCECYLETGNCRLATGHDKNDSITRGYSRAIIEFEIDKKEDVQSKTFDDLFREHQKEFTLPDHFNRQKDSDEIFFSNIYNSFDDDDDHDDGNFFLGDHAVYESAKDVIDKNYKFPIFYTVNKTEEGSVVRIDTKTTVKIGDFKVAGIIECLSYYDGTQQVSKKNIFGREGYNLEELECTWGNQTYQMEQLESSSNSNRIFQLNIVVLLFLISLCYVVINI